MKKSSNSVLIAIFAAFAVMGFSAVSCNLIPSGDSIRPTVFSTVPTASALEIALSDNITTTFSEDMAPATIIGTSFMLKAGTTPVAGVVTYTGNTATFNPTSELDRNTVYTATVTTAVTDVEGNAMAENKVWSFTTSTAADINPPSVLSTFPLNLATSVSSTGAITADFSESMDAATIVAANFTVAAGADVTGTVTYDVLDKSAIFSPSVELSPDTQYTATVTTGVKDTAGNAMTVNKIWTFTTVAAAARLGPAPVLLGTAGTFVVLAKSAISTVPDSVITGNVGISPAAESFMTGFSQTKYTGYSLSPQVTGSMYAADMTSPTPSNMTTAISNMETAYTDAAGRTSPDQLNLGAGTLNADTLAPGLYTWGTTVNITGDITIAGAANDVWIFQITGDLAVSPGKSVILSGGAQAKNIFWQITGQATLGTTAHFEGIVLSKTAITLGTGASINGRLLAQTQVALAKATVTKPAL